MGSVNISLKKEAYEFLKSIKTGDKSFSDVILEFKGKKDNKENILKFFGALNGKNVDWKEKEKKMKEFRSSFNKKIEFTSKKMRDNR